MSGPAIAAHVIRTSKPWPDQPNLTGRLTICAGEDTVSACMVMGAYCNGRINEAVLVHPLSDDPRVISVSVKPGMRPFEPEPVLYDRWRDVDVAGRVWSVVAGLLDGRIVWAPAEPDSFEQLGLFAPVGFSLKETTK